MATVASEIDDANILFDCKAPAEIDRKPIIVAHSVSLTGELHPSSGRLGPVKIIKSGYNSSQTDKLPLTAAPLDLVKPIDTPPNYSSADGLLASSDLLGPAVGDVNEEVVDLERDERQNQNSKSNTERVTVCHLKMFNKFLGEQNEHRTPEDIEPESLDPYLARFVAGIRKEGTPKDDGEIDDENSPARQYEPDTLGAIHCSICRYLKGRGYPVDIKHDELFRNSRSALRAKQDELKLLGKGNKPRALQPFTAVEIRRLAECRLIGTGTLPFYYVHYRHFVKSAFRS